MIKVLIGKSAAGKDTMLQKEVANGARPIVSYTDRPMRVGEVNGREYHFVTQSKLFSMYVNLEFCDFRSYKTNVNGKPATWSYASPWVDAKEDWICILDCNGAENFIRKYGKENVNVIYLDVDDKTREERARKRGSFDETEWKRRLIADTEDFSEKKLTRLSRLLDRPIEVIKNY